MKFFTEEQVAQFEREFKELAKELFTYAGMGLLKVIGVALGFALLVWCLFGPAYVVSRTDNWWWLLLYTPQAIGMLALLGAMD